MVVDKTVTHDIIIFDSRGPVARMLKSILHSSPNIHIVKNEETLLDAFVNLSEAKSPLIFVIEDEYDFLKLITISKLDVSIIFATTNSFIYKNLFRNSKIKIVDLSQNKILIQRDLINKIADFY